MSAILAPAVFQVPLAQNNQYARWHCGVASPAPLLHVTCFHLILRMRDELRENFHLAVKYCYVLNLPMFPNMYFLSNIKFCIQI